MRRTCRAPTGTVHPPCSGVRQLSGWLLLGTASLALLLSGPLPAQAAPKSDLWPIWQNHSPESEVRIDHRLWTAFLSRYVVGDHPSGVNRVRYSQVTPLDRVALETYLEDLQRVIPSALNRSEQRAFWINAYNAQTVKLILDHLPVRTIRDIDISPGLFSDGPWDAKLFTVAGIDLSLNDIEHRILRPIWKDSRIHYAVNCASIGCPNLQPVAYDADNTEALLARGAREYINHPRGVSVDGRKVTLSSIYRWFREDFGSSEEDVLEHILRFADNTLQEEIRKLRTGKVRFKYRYDWSLNADTDSQPEPGLSLSVHPDTVRSGT